MRAAPLLVPILLLASPLAGCKRPPSAPGELSELSSYFFEHMADEDDAALAAGVENLAAWYQDNGLSEPEDGFEVKAMSTEAAYGLPDIDLSELSQQDFEDGIVGAAVVTEHNHELDQIVWTLVIADQQEVFPDDYQVFDRTFLTDESCFMAHGCGQVDALNYSEASYAGVMNVKSENHAQWRWVDTENRRAMVHRAWLTAPADINPALATIPAEFFTTVTMPLDDGTMVRMQTVWFVAQLASMEANAFMLHTFVGALKNTGDQVETYMDDNPDWGGGVDTAGPGTYSGGQGSCSTGGGTVAFAGLPLLLLGLVRRRASRVALR